MRLLGFTYFWPGPELGCREPAARSPGGALGKCPCEVLAARLGDAKCPEKKGNAIFAPHAREAFFPKKLSNLREEKIPEKLKIWGLKF